MRYILMVFLLLFSTLTIASTSKNEIISFRCTFPDGVSTTWEDEGYKTERGKGFDNFIYFDAINLKEHTARMIGNQGSGSLEVFSMGAGITLIEITATGNFITTTIFPILNKDNKYPAVMSRHVNIIDTSLVLSQFYGYCERWN